MPSISSSCGRPDEHKPHWITQPTPGVMGGHSCLGHAATPSDVTLTFRDPDTPAAEVADREAQIKAEVGERIAQAIERSAATFKAERTEHPDAPTIDAAYAIVLATFDRTARIARAAALTDPTPDERGKP